MIVRETIYQQLNQALKSLVESGKYTGGSRFLTEREVCRQFEVSRPTANKALASLVSEGLLEFRKGVGTFVAGGGLDYDLQSLVSFTGRARAAGKSPATRVLRFERKKSARFPKDVARQLNTSDTDEIVHLQRLRLADTVPMILERRYIAARHCPDLTRAVAAGSLYEFWTDTCKLDVAGARQSIRAVNLGASDAKLLSLHTGASALLADAVGYLFGNTPLWVESTLYRGDRYEFHTQLGGLAKKRSSLAVNRFAEFAAD